MIQFRIPSRWLARWFTGTFAITSVVGAITVAACSSSSSDPPNTPLSTAQQAAITCPPGMTACPFDGVTACVNTSFDPTNCGACGATCAFGQVCSNGACTGTAIDAGTTCPPGTTTCQINGFNACVSTSTDPTNCGACGRACGVGQFCSNGTCTGTAIDAGITCPTGTTSCQINGVTACINTSIDPTNCGECGNTCAFGQFCSNGRCTGNAIDAGVTCPPPTTACPFDGVTACVNTSFDPTNCGACGRTCAFGQFCSNGTCTGNAIDAGITCPPGTTACQIDGITACFNTSIDPTNCGACGRTCGPGQFCSNGSCTGNVIDAGITCPTGTTSCQFNGLTACVNTSIDPFNCGACGNACAFGQFCSNGRCTGNAIDAGMCPTGATACQTDAGTICVNTSIDPTNCGACGNGCRFGQSCTNGTCTGNAVDSGATDSGTTDTGATDSGVTCPTGTTACQTDGGTTCVDTSTDPANCGACGSACAEGDVCMNGECSVCPASLL